MKSAILASQIYTCQTTRICPFKHPVQTKGGQVSGQSYRLCLQDMFRIWMLCLYFNI